MGLGDRADRINSALFGLALGMFGLILGRTAPRTASDRTSDEDADDPLVSMADQIHLFRQIMDDRVESLMKRSEQVSSRAGILIAASALSATLGSPGAAGNGWAALAILSTLAAAVAGVMAVFPMKDSYPDLSELRDRILEASPGKAELLHSDEQVRIYEERVKRLSWRAWVVRAGFCLLGASILCRSAIVLGIAVSIV